MTKKKPQMAMLDFTRDDSDELVIPRAENSPLPLYMIDAEKHKYCLYPKEQRGTAWSDQYRREFIRTAFECGGYSDPIHVVKNLRTLEWDVLEGQQRLQSIFSFFNNELTISCKMPGRSKCSRLRYDDIKRQAQTDDIIRRKLDRFQNSILWVAQYPPMSDAKRLVLFDRLNRQVSLTNTEKVLCKHPSTRSLFKEFWGAISSLHGHGTSKVIFDKSTSKNHRYSGLFFIFRVCRFSFGTVFDSDTLQDFVPNTYNFEKSVSTLDGLIQHEKLCEEYELQLDRLEGTLVGQNILKSMDLVEKTSKILYNVVTPNPLYLNNIYYLTDIFCYILDKVRSKVFNPSFCKENSAQIYDVLNNYTKVFKEMTTDNRYTKQGEFPNRMLALDSLMAEQQLDMGIKNHRVSQNDKVNILLNSDRVCPITGEKLTLNNTEIDHVEPKSKNSSGKLAAISKTGNRIKSNLSPTTIDNLHEYKEKVAKGDIYTLGYES